MKALFILLIVCVISLMVMLYFIAKMRSERNTARRAEEKLRTHLANAGKKLCDLQNQVEYLENFVKSQKAEIERLTNGSSQIGHPPDDNADVESDNKPNNNTEKKI